MFPKQRRILRKKFRQLWERTAASKQTGRQPSPHSLRHAFVVNRINAWATEGSDVESLMPYLSAYLGHAGVGETFYYYHQSFDAMAVVRERDTVLSRVAPEVIAHGQ